MRILIFGGAFDPPHQGHVNAAKAAYDRIKPDIFYIIPAFDPPLKDAPVTQSSHRMNMCALAFGDIPNAVVSDIEIKRGEKSYTYITLAEIKEKHPESEIFLLVGADQLEQFEKWARYEYILENCTLCVAGRGKKEINKKYEKVILLENEKTDISSTEIRAGVRDKLPEKVYEYIKEKGLYRGNHVEGVIKYAEMLRADCFPYLDKADVFTAASMHDSTKGLDQQAIFESHGVEIDSDMKNSPAVMHAFTAALNMEKQGEKESVVNAVRYHTTGRPNMTDIEKVVFIADYIEENRRYDHCVRMREEYLKHRGSTDINNMIKQILNSTVQHLEEKGDFIHPLTLQAMEYYKQGE